MLFLAHGLFLSFFPSYGVGSLGATQNATQLWPGGRLLASCRKCCEVGGPRNVVGSRGGARGIPHPRREDLGYCEARHNNGTVGRPRGLHQARAGGSGDRGGKRDEPLARGAIDLGMRGYVQRLHVFRRTSHAAAPLQLRGSRLHSGGAAAHVVCEPRLEHALCANGLDAQLPHAEP